MPNIWPRAFDAMVFFPKNHMMACTGRRVPEDVKGDAKCWLTSKEAQAVATWKLLDPKKVLGLRRRRSRTLVKGLVIIYSRESHTCSGIRALPASENVSHRVFSYCQPRICHQLLYMPAGAAAILMNPRLTAYHDRQARCVR